jgi:hypothetical protein
LWWAQMLYRENRGKIVTLMTTLNDWWPMSRVGEFGTMMCSATIQTKPNARQQWCPLDVQRGEGIYSIKKSTVAEYIMHKPCLVPAALMKSIYLDQTSGAASGYNVTVCLSIWYPGIFKITTLHPLGGGEKEAGMSILLLAFNVERVPRRT